MFNTTIITRSISKWQEEKAVAAYEQITVVWECCIRMALTIDNQANSEILNEQFSSVFTRDDGSKLPHTEDSPYQDISPIEFDVSGIGHCQITQQFLSHQGLRSRLYY